MSSYIKIITLEGTVEFDDRSSNERKMKPVRQKDKNGNEIAQFASIAEAERLTNIRHIYECVGKHPKRKTAGGFEWELVEGE